MPIEKSPSKLAILSFNRQVVRKHVLQLVTVLLPHSLALGTRTNKPLARLFDVRDFGRGDLPLKSEALADALAHPKASNKMRGNVYFMLGDVEKGVTAWREMEPEFVHLLWQFNKGSEHLWHPIVLDDPRYQTLLDDLGVGRRWSAYMYEQTLQLADITGIHPTTPVETPEINLIARFGGNVSSAADEIDAAAN